MTPSHGFSKGPSPEERELERKRGELAAAIRRRDERIRERATLREEIALFESSYARTLGKRIAELDELEDKIRTVTRNRDLTFRKFSGRGYEEIAVPRFEDGQAEPEREPAPEDRGGKGSGEEPTAGRRIKELYRRVAKAIHPDLSVTEDERARRQQLMAEANRAYEEQDGASLETLLYEWECGPDSVKGHGPGAELIRLIRRIAMVEENVAALEEEILVLRDSELYQLILRVEDARHEGIDMLAEMAAKVDLDIARARKRLFELTGERRDAEGGGNAIARLVIFPPDVLLGTLYIRSAGSDNYRDWDRFGDALGAIAVPAGKVLRLDAKECSPAYLQFLRDLNPDDLQALFLYEADDACLDSLASLTGLEQLYLGGDGVTDAGIAPLRALTGLKKLYLYDTGVTREGVAALKELPWLRWLTFSDSKIDEDALEALRREMPMCKIVNLKRPTRPAD